MSLNLPLSDMDARWTRADDEPPENITNFASIGLSIKRTLDSSVTATWAPPEGYISIGEGADSTTGPWRYQLCVKAVERQYVAFDTDTYTAQVFEFWVARLNRLDYSLDSWINVSPSEPKLDGAGLGNFREAWSPEQHRDYATNALSVGGARRRCSDGLDTANQTAWVESGDLQGELHGALWLPGDRLMLRVASANQISCWDLITGTRLWITESYSQIPADYCRLSPDTDPTNPPWGSGFNVPGGLTFETTAWDVLAQTSANTVLVLTETRKFVPLLSSALNSTLEWETELASWEGGGSAGVTAFGTFAQKWVYDGIGAIGLTTDPANEDDEIPSFGFGTTESNGGVLPGKPNQYGRGLSGATAPLPASYVQHASRALAQAELGELQTDFGVAAEVSKYFGHACSSSTLRYREIDFVTGAEVSSFSPALIDNDRGLQFREPEKNRLGKSILQVQSWNNISALNLSPHPDSQCYVMVDDGEGGLEPDRTPGNNQNLNGFFILPAAELSGYEGGAFFDSTDPEGIAAAYIWHITGSDADPLDPNDRTQYTVRSNNSGALAGLTNGGQRLFPIGQYVFRDPGEVVENPPLPPNHLSGAIEWAAARIYHPLHAGNDQYRTLAKPLPHHSGKLVAYNSDTLIFLPRDITFPMSYINPGNAVPTLIPAIVSDYNEECRWSHHIVCYKRDSEDPETWAVAWSLNTHDLWPPAAPVGDTDALDQTIGDCPTNGFVAEDGRLYTIIKGADGYYAIRVPVVDIDGVTAGTVEQSVKLDLGGLSISPNRLDFKDALVVAQRELLICVSEGAGSKFLKLG